MMASSPSNVLEHSLHLGCRVGQASKIVWISLINVYEHFETPCQQHFSSPISSPSPSSVGVAGGGG